MKLVVDNRIIETTVETDAELYATLVVFIPPFLKKVLNDTSLLLLKQVFRGMLYQLELTYPEQRAIIRPPKGTDPLVHLLTIGKDSIAPVLKDATITLTTEPNGYTDIARSISIQFQPPREGG